MNKTYRDYLLKVDRIRVKDTDQSKIRSLLASIETNTTVVLTIPVTKETATVIFRELYESIRQLGDAFWWQEGYEPRDHDVSIELLEVQAVKNPSTLSHLQRYKNLRHEINYRGFQASEAQAKEIIGFWNTSGKEILEHLRKLAKNT